MFITQWQAGMGLWLGSRRALEDENLTPLDVVDFFEEQSVYAYHRPVCDADIGVGGFLAFFEGERTDECAEQRMKKLQNFKKCV